jgi:hypothetical protein
LSWRARLEGSDAFARSGTIVKINAAPARMVPAKIRNVVRQPTRLTMYSVGAVATTMPRAPKDMIVALARERRSSGTQSDEALKLAIRPPAKPRPITARAANRVGKPDAEAKSAQPRAAMVSMTACTRRGP